MSAKEIIDILNDAGEVIGTVSREEAERDNHITQNVLVFVFNSSGRVWVQLRPITKTHYPGKWDISACGGILSGETPAQAAERETLEETGLRMRLYSVDSFLNAFPGDNGEERKRLSHLFIGISDGEPQVNPEVDDFKDWDPNELREDVAARPDAYIPSFLVEFDMAVEGYNALLS